MASWSWDRLASAGGVIGAVLFTVGFAIAGEQPKLGDGGEAIASYFVDDRERILLGATVIGLAAAVFLWFTGAVANRCREAGEGRLAATTIASGSAAFGVLIVLVGMFAGLAYGIAETGETGIVVALYYVTFSLGALLCFPTALFIGAASVGLARGGVLPSWFAWFGSAAAVLIALGGTVWAREGIWSLDGAYGYLTIILLMVWMVVASSMLAARTEAAHAPRPALTS